MKGTFNGIIVSVPKEEIQEKKSGGIVLSVEKKGDAKVVKVFAKVCPVDTCIDVGDAVWVESFKLIPITLDDGEVVNFIKEEDILMYESLEEK